jgi:capsular polysaccharide biosynthesis protein
MAMLQALSPQQPIAYEDQGQSLDLSYLIGILKRRIVYFAIPFVLIVMVGFGIVAVQRPIFRAEGKILVESPEIPPDLVHPTITEVANERVQVIQQRIMARDNLMAVVNKYNLFSREREWMSGTELLDLMRSRMGIKPVDLDAQGGRPNGSPTIAFTLTFDYEVPAIAMGVANEFLTSILSEDATTRTNNAAETTKFLDREVKRLQNEHDSVVAQIVAAKQRPADPEQTQSDEARLQAKDLADAQAQLLQASAVYSDEHPLVKNLKKKIAALKRAIAATPQAAATATEKASSSDVNLLTLERREAEIDRSLEDANRKLSVARLGESMERGQVGERLRVIEQPSLPQKPVRPQRPKWYAVAFVLAGMIGAGAVFAAEMLDGSIRGSRDLGRVVDKHLIVTIPYLSTPGEEYRKRRNLILLCTALVAVLAAAIALAVAKGVSIDFFWVDQSWMDTLTRLLH